MSKFKVAIFDYDGVICDSVFVKTEAFRELYRDYDKDKLDIIETYHLRNGGISRYEKIKHFERIFFNREISESKLNMLADRFAHLVFQKVVNSPFLPGVIDFIECCRKRNIKVFICTGTPQKEISVIVEKQGIDDLFDGIFGSPKSKVNIIEHIMSKFDFDISEYIFFGDAITDLEAAQATGIRFLGLENVRTDFPGEISVIPHFENVSVDSF
ncbi:HAD hydrolase-like protein [Schleiferiaceae bacterium]|nr:HAD hydrolase-like protein [Schleiferiaceae bacterium]